MKVSLRWLSEFIDLPTSDPHQVANAFAMLGHDVDGYETITPSWTNVYVGKVLSVEAHPSADRVRVCQVDTGDGPEQIICGAWNFDTGAIVAVAKPGAVLPGDFRIGVREIRGVVSNGMICSERELGLGDDHDGIMVLDSAFRVGELFADQIELPDTVFDLAITPNRPDAMSMLGIARDLAAHYGIGYRIPSIYWKPVAGETEFDVTIADPSGCSRFNIREIVGVKVGASPFRIRHRLRKAGVRPISNVVDATNYVMLELGQPLHAFDADTIVGNRLTVKRAETGETLETLDGAVRTLSDTDLIIYDGAGPASMSGTMGGARTEVTASTTRILMEAASWDPPTIMYMARRHDLRSEASTRFERGVDPNLVEAANQRVSAMVADLSGGRVLEGSIDRISVPTRPIQIDLDIADIERLLGPGFTEPGVTEILRRLGMGVDGTAPMTVTVPTFRPDLTRPADLAEEVARIHGFDKFEPTLPTGPSGGLSPEQRRQRKLITVLTGLGVTQAINLPFVNPADVAPFGFESGQLLTVKNPLREEESKLRPTLLAGLLEVIRYNLSHGSGAAAVFEIGRVFKTVPDNSDRRLPQQPERIAWALAGDFRSDGAGADGAVSATLWTAIGRHLGIEATVTPTSQPSFHPGRCLAVAVDGTTVGHVGELHPATARAFDLPLRVGIGEVDLAALLAPREHHLAKSPSVFPHVDFDLSFQVPTDLSGGALVGATSAAAGELLESARVFDEFTGGAEGRRSIAIRYRLRASDRTLTGDEIAQVRAAMIETAGEMGASFRTA